MKRKVLERFNWEQTVDSTERLYRRVLNNHHILNRETSSTSDQSQAHTRTP